MRCIVQRNPVCVVVDENFLPKEQKIHENGSFVVVIIIIVVVFYRPLSVSFLASLFSTFSPTLALFFFLLLFLVNLGYDTDRSLFAARVSFALHRQNQCISVGKGSQPHR